MKLADLFRRIKTLLRKPRNLAWSLLCCSLVITGIMLLPRRDAQRITLQRAVDRVQVMIPHVETTRAEISGFGTVEASKQLEIRSELFGRIQNLHPKFEVGGQIGAGEVLIQIDPRDYEAEVQTRKAELAKAEFELKLELGNQVVAKREWKLLSEDNPVGLGNEDLALRKPHLREKQAALLGARSQLQKAELDLARTRIVAPFSGIILEESVEVGSALLANETAAQFTASDEFYVRLRIPNESLGWIDTPTSLDSSKPDLKAQISYRLREGLEFTREGRFIRLLGQVDPKGRMVQVLVSIPHPLEQIDEKPPLLLGSYVKVILPGKVLKNVLRIPRRTLYQQNRVFVADSASRLRSRVLAIVFSTELEIFAVAGLEMGDRIIISPLQRTVEGTVLEVQEAEGSR